MVCIESWLMRNSPCVIFNYQISTSVISDDLTNSFSLITGRWFVHLYVMSVLQTGGAVHVCAFVNLAGWVQPFKASGPFWFMVYLQRKRWPHTFPNTARQKNNSCGEEEEEEECGSKSRGWMDTCWREREGNIEFRPFGCNSGEWKEK